MPGGGQKLTVDPVLPFSSLNAEIAENAETLQVFSAISAISALNFRSVYEFDFNLVGNDASLVAFRQQSPNAFPSAFSVIER